MNIISAITAIAEMPAAIRDLTKELKELGEKFIKLIKSKFKLIKYDKLASGGYAKFMKDKKNIFAVWRQKVDESSYV